VLQQTSRFDTALNEPTVCAFEDGWRLLSGQIKWEQLYGKAYSRFQKVVSINREISILNFVHELRDLKRMFHIWSRQLSFLLNIANGHLNLKYGWKPFIQDVISIWQALSKSQKQLKLLLEREGTIRYFRTKLNSYGDLFDVLPVDHGPYGSSPVIRCSDNVADGLVPIAATSSIKNPTKMPVRCIVKYSYGLPKVSLAQAKLRAHLEAFGLTMDPQIVWDAIPFSFVVDWFWRVGDWLHDLLSVATYPVELRIHEAAFSYSPIQVTVCAATYTIGDITASPPSQAVVPVTYEGKRFYRHRHLPSKDDLLYSGWARNLLDKVLTGTALVFTNTNRTHIKTKPLPRNSGRRRYISSTQVPGNWLQSASKWA
jgi:hypothetical protein